MLLVDTETYEQMEEDFGLYALLEQNDIEPWEVIRMLHLNGLIDMEDYFFDVAEVFEEDDD